MKNQINTVGMVLTRTDFQEADRIITVLTPDQGKIRLIAKGSRRAKSKLAGGIELFSVSEISFLPGKREIGTLTSSRLQRHFGSISQDINRTMLGYEFLKRLHKITEDQADAEYFDLLHAGLEGLNILELTQELVDLWFTVQLLHISGHSPNLSHDTSGQKLTPDSRYMFDFEDMTFIAHTQGSFDANHIKLLRLAAQVAQPTVLQQVTNADEFLPESLQLAKTMLKRYIRI